MTNNNSHRDCRHEATKAARTACRKLRAQGIDTTTGLAEIAAHHVARTTDHNLYCGWHNAMSYLENWTDSQIEDPTAEWCKGEPTRAIVIQGTEDLLSDLCRCQDSPDNWHV